jgi:hypothetical protein
MRNYFSEIIRMHIPIRREHQETDLKIPLSKTAKSLGVFEKEER